MADAAKSSEMVILAIPTAAVTTLPLEAFSGKLIIDANNYCENRDGEITDISDRALASPVDRGPLPGSNVVKRRSNDRVRRPTRSATAVRPATTTASRCRWPPTTRPPSGPSCGVVDELGFDPVDAGTLDESWRQQPGTPRLRERPGRR